METLLNLVVGVNLHNTVIVDFAEEQGVVMIAEPAEGACLIPPLRNKFQYGLISSVSENAYMIILSNLIENHPVLN